MKRRVMVSLMVLTICICISSNFKLTAYGEGQLDKQQSSAKEAIELNLIPEDVKYGYNDATTREALTLMMIHLIEMKSDKSISDILNDNGLFAEENPFNDTKSKSIIAAEKLGIINGRGNELFDPLSNVTRQEAAVMIANTAKVLELDLQAVQSNFIDNENIADWAIEAVSYVTDKNIMNGFEDNRFDPKSSYSRSESFGTILKISQIYDKENKVDSNDNIINEVESELKSLAESIKNNSNNTEIQQQLEKFYKEYNKQDMKNIFYADTDGSFMIVPYIQLPDTYEPRDRQWYKEAIKNGKYISQPYTDITDEENQYITIAITVVVDDEVLGVIALDVVSNG